MSRRNRLRQVDSKIQENFRQALTNQGVRERLRRLRMRIFEAQQTLRFAEITLEELEKVFEE